ncbi:hypothetical protein D3C77_407470 [compost metagenome]
MLPDRTITVIPLNRNSLLRYINHLLRQAEANYLGHLRIGFCIPMRHSHAAAHRDVKTLQLSVLYNRNEPQILRENINIVRRRYSYANLELTRQIDMSVNRLLLRLAVIAVNHLFTVKPNLMVSIGSRIKMIAYLARPVVYLGMNFRLVWVGIAHHVSVNVATCGQRAEQCLIHFLNGFLQVPFDNTMELKGLPGCQTNGSVRIFLGYAVHHQPLLRCNDTARRAHSKHKLIGWLQFLFMALVPQITIILHIAAMEFHQPIIIFRYGARNWILKRLF